ERILIHETEHVKQKHSVDIMILEMLTVFQWCNPFIWLIRRLVRENHEFLADKAVLDKGFSPSGYKLLLLSQVAGDGFLITNNFNYSLIKNRIRMISKNKSSKYAIVPIFAGLMIAAGLLVSLHLQAGNMKMVSTLKSLPQSAIQLWNGNIQADGSALNNARNTDASDVGSMPAKMTSELVPNKKQLSQNAEKEGNKKKNTIDMITVCGYGDSSDTIKKEKEKVYLAVDQMPVFPGGTDQLLRFLIMNVRYPAAAQKQGLEGTEVISFVINTKGEISNIKIVRSIGIECDEEAVRIVKLMPKWKPGMDKGKVVPVQYTLPIKFVLQREERTKK
ncbi:MAG: M56 family metallopeptidase, partial [Bacteroidota bacterium]|nr:M56 family metallopeptidase [Bacteroidota bacterium]